MEENFDNTLKLLTEKVNQITGNKPKQKPINFNYAFINKFDFKSPTTYYIGIPIIIIIFLVMIKPKIILTDTEGFNKDKNQY